MFSRILSGSRSIETLALPMLLQFITCLVILFDIPVARQLIGFLYFTVVPGYVFVRLMKLESISRVETGVFSVGFSIAFLMFAALITNQLCLWLGISSPLSLTPLMVTFNALILLGEITVYFRSRNGEFTTGNTVGIHLSTWLVVCLPMLGIIGAFCVYVLGSNLILLLMIMAISIVFVIGVVRGQLPKEFYPLALVMIAISLILSSTLVSNNLINFGSDLSLEYSICEGTFKNLQWSPIAGSGFGRFDPILSITILPTVYSNLLNMDLNSVFKILFPLVFSIVPLGLYQLWQKKLGSKNAFIAVFFVVAQETFYTEMLGLGRQIIAELFFALLLIVILNKKIQHSKMIICFTVLGTGLVMSHYAIAIIFALFLSLTLIFLEIVKNQRSDISASMVLIFLVIMFSWYIFISGGAAFSNLLSYGNYVYAQLGQFFNIASRGETVLRGLGLGSAPSIWNQTSRVFGYLTELLIAIGFIGMITRRMKPNFEQDDLSLSTIAVGFLAALILVPGLANTFNMTRFYHILLFFLAPLCVIGAGFLTKLVTKHRREIFASILLLAIIVPFFLFQTSFVYEVLRSQSYSLSLSGYRMSPYELNHLGYTDDESVLGAYWVRTNVLALQTPIYADLSSASLLISYGSIALSDVLTLSNVTVVSENGTVFLSSLNVIDRMVLTSYFYNSLDNLTFLRDMSQVYSNGRNEIYSSHR